MTLEICFVFNSLSVHSLVIIGLELLCAVSYLPRPESEPPELLETPVRFVTSPRFDKAPMSVSVVALHK